MSVFDNEDDLDPQFNINNSPELNKDKLVTPPGTTDGSKVTTTVSIAASNGSGATTDRVPVYAEKLAVIERRKAKIVDMKDVEETILASGALSQESVSYVDENYSFYNKTGRTKSEFTKQPSRTNFDYVCKWMSSQIKTEQASLDAETEEVLELIKTDAVKTTNMLTEAVSRFLGVREVNRESLRQMFSNKESLVVSVEGRDSNNQLTAVVLNLLTDPVPMFEDAMAYARCSGIKLALLPKQMGAYSLMRVMVRDRNNDSILVFMSESEAIREAYRAKRELCFSDYEVDRESVSLFDIFFRYFEPGTVMDFDWLTSTYSELVANKELTGIDDVYRTIVSLADFVNLVCDLIPLTVAITAGVK